MSIYTTKELRQKTADKKWIMSYNKITAVVDDRAKKVMYIENYGPKDGYFVEGWRALHYPLTSKLVEKSYREGNITICILKEGKSKLNLIPSLSPFGIEQCVIKNNTVEITMAGIGGAGVSASFSRGMADGVKQVNVLDEGGGRKIGRSTLVIEKSRLLLIGVDDTDNDQEGATYSLVHNISLDVAEKYGVEYCIHVNIQLYPYNPHKTKNCFGTVVGFIFKSDSEKRKIISYFKKQLKLNTFSLQTGMAAYEGFNFSRKIWDFCNKIKFTFFSEEKQLISAAKKEGFEVYPITGTRGLIGAIGSIPFFDKPDFAAKLPTQCR